jgi:hypothetical protein
VFDFLSTPILDLIAQVLGFFLKAPFWSQLFVRQFFKGSKQLMRFSSLLSLEGKILKHAIEYKCVQYKKISIDMFNPKPPHYLSPSQ